METLEAQGNIAEAVRVFDQLRRLVRDELGTAPSPVALEISERLLRPGSRSRKPLNGGAPPEVAVELPAELAMRADAPLVGRKRELTELGQLWQQAREGRVFGHQDSARLVLLTGDPGIGKTRLVAEVASDAHEAGAFVLAGRSTEETLVPYQPFLEALRHYVVNAPFSALRATAREYGSELARLIPELRRRAPDLPLPVAGERETERYRLFEAVVGLLAEISNLAPAMLVLDDLQWADRPTLLLLRHLARSINPGRLLILGAFRTTETMAGGFAEALSDLRREGLVTQMPIGGLSESATAELVALQTGTMPSHSFIRELHAETEGNPFFIGEIVRHLSEAGVRTDLAGAHEVQRVGLPEGVKEVIARRLARLDSQAIEWLRVAAVIGRDFDADLLEEVLSFSEDEFLNVLEEALASSLVVEVPDRHGRYSFSHALIRETLYEGMSAPRRARIHRRVGEVLEARDPERYLTSLALHFTRAAGAEDAEKAIQYAQRAGEQATAMLAHEEAADHYARALEVQDRFAGADVALRCELLLMLGEARVRAGERPQAWPTFREAATLAVELGETSRLARAAIGASRRYIQPPGLVDEELIALLEQALSLTEGDRGVVRVALLTRLCGVLYYSPRRVEMVELAAEATELATELGDPEALALAAGARRRAFWAPDQLDQRLADSTALLTLARQAGDLELVLQGHAWLVVDLLEHGQPDAVQAQIQAFTEGARRLRQPLYSWQASIWLAMRALLEGRLDDADRLAADALAAGSHGETVTAPQYYAMQLLAIRREQDRMGELEQAARDLLATNPDRPAWRAALLTLVRELGRVDEAREEFETAMRDFELAPRDGDWLIAATLLADAAAELGDRDRAAQMYEVMLPYRHGNVVIGLAAVCLGSAARYLGRLALAVGRREAAIEHLELALARNAALGTPLYLAHTQLDYARALGPGARATELVEAAAKTAAELGLAYVERRVRMLRER